MTMQIIGKRGCKKHIRLQLKQPLRQQHGEKSSTTGKFREETSTQATEFSSETLPPEGGQERFSPTGRIKYIR